MSTTRSAVQHRQQQKTQEPKTLNEFSDIMRNLDQGQRQMLMKTFPQVFLKDGNMKDTDAAQVLSALAQSHEVPASMRTHLEDAAKANRQLQLQNHNPNPYSNGAQGEPGPSSHPRGPPALLYDPHVIQQQTSSSQHNHNHHHDQLHESDNEGDADEHDDGPKTPGGSKRGRSATMGTEEWTRQRKDNHKEVERRRRGAINSGIAELGRIVPSGNNSSPTHSSASQPNIAKGAILSRAVQYIHHLKENEARNIEKWTLEKLLMDQAMGDLQGQLEECKRLWEEARVGRERAERELEELRRSQDMRGAKRMRNE